MHGTRGVDVAEAIDKAPVSAVQKRAIGLCIAIAVIDGFDAQSIGFAAPRIAEDWETAVSSFGPVFSLGLVGMMLGGMIFGPVSDRIGRRSVIIGCTVMFGVLTLVTSQAQSVETLMALRFLTGLGLGGITPNLIALAAEYAPARLRTTVVTVVVCAFSVGGFAGGFIAAWLIPALGWRGLFIIGGVIPLAIAAVAYRYLPESVRYLTVAGRTEQAAEIVRRINPSIPPGSVPELPGTTTTEKSSIVSLFADGRTTRTLILWAVFFMNLLVIYFVLSWMPSLFGQAGLSSSTALIATSLFNLGGVVGGIVIGRLSDTRDRPFGTIATAYVIGAVFIGITALAFDIVPVLLVAVFLIGVGVSGSQTGISAVAAATYPTNTRATGVGWAYGIGRIGSIIGPTLGGLLIGIGLAPVTIFTLTIIPTLLAAVAIMQLARVVADRSGTKKPGASSAEVLETT
ncbi:MFS transporter [Nocardia flavorosea]|uniref:MFS transporter n=1 Tax=Nocardia flavorosea TaxID=53429 RepID=A0A846YLQ4_9NOCA|nr:MFS transporter [Nocardia flavorosea]NKY60586.1 MFS transporter [Nocardia flavorosea]